MTYLTDPDWLAVKDYTPSLEVITPEIAKVWIGRRAVYQRRITKQHLSYLTREMTSGSWVDENGSTICFDTEGNLCDGQNRISAIIESERPMRAIVARGLPPKAFDTIDTGKPRSASDALSRNGARNAVKLAAVIRVLHRFDETKARFMNYKAKVPIHVVTDYWELEQEKLEIAVSWGQVASRANLAPCAPIAAFYFVISKIDEELAEEYMQLLTTGVTSDPESAVLLARNNLFKIKGSKGKTDDILFLFPSLSHAWNCLRVGQGLKVFKAPAPENATIKGIKKNPGWITRGIL